MDFYGEQASMDEAREAYQTLIELLNAQSSSEPSSISQQKTIRRNYSDPAAKRLIERQIGTALTLVDGSFTEMKPLHFEAVLNDDSRYGLFLSFMVGSEKLLVAKDLPELQDRLVYPGRMKLSNKTELWIAYDAFNEQSKPLVDFFMTHYYEHTINPRNSYYYSTINSTPKKMMPLTQVHYDELFSALVGRSITVNDEDGKQNYQVVQSDPDISLVLTNVEDGAILEVSGGHRIHRGSKHAYVFMGNNVYICSESFSKACSDILEALYSTQGRQLFFHATDIPTLLSTVLHDTDGAVPVTLVGDFDSYETPPLSTRVYFDIDELDNCITAQMVFAYDNDQHFAFMQKELETSHNILGELYAEELLFRYMGTFYVGDGTLKHLGDEAEIFELATEGIDRLMQVAELYFSETFIRIKVRPPVVVNVGVKLRGHLLDIDFDIENIDFQDLAEALEAYRQSKKYIRLRDGSFLPVDKGSIPQAAELLDGLDLSEQVLADGHVEVESNRALYLDALLKRADSLGYSRDEAMRRVARMMQNVADAAYQVPAHLEPVLRDYQQVGYRWLKTLEELEFGGILADDMGLGKTLQVLTVLQAKIENRNKDRNKNSTTSTTAGGIKSSATSNNSSLVICPASLVFNWCIEANKFTPDLRVAAVTGNASERRSILKKANDFDLLVTSYDQFRRNLHDYENLEFDLIVLDEAQRIKNQNALVSKAVKKLQGNTRLALTGTPIENNLAELWSIFDFIMPGYLRSYNRFRSNYEIPIIKRKDQAKTDNLRALVRPFILRRLKKDVLQELPEKIENTLTVALGEEQQKLYLGTMAKIKKELAERLAEVSSGQGRIAVLAALTRIRQICCDPSLVYGDYSGDSAKREACLELITSCIESGHRILLFSQFTSMLDILEQDLAEQKITYYRLDGSTPKTIRQNLVDRFNSDNTSVFLISLRAGGTGLNLTGADVVIHYDPWWNLSVQNQATDRTHRIGQQNVVQVFKLIAQDTVEERIQILQEQKADLANEIIMEGGNAFDTLTSEELLALFENEV
jgi:SNF2 family DNA or RNA helicase